MRKKPKKTQTQRQNSSHKYIDPVTRYAEAVLADRIIAGPWVKLACKRHISDLDRDGKDLEWFWGNNDYEGARRAVGFFEKVLKLNGGQFEGAPFVLRDWQVFIVGSIFGWLKNGLRRYQLAYIEIGKGNGKSPLAAGVGLYMLTQDKEARAEVYAAATKKDQAMILFRDAVAMRDQSPFLSTRLIKSGVGEKTWNLAYHDTGSWFRPISSDDNSQSGPRPHCALVDELHEHKTAVVVDMMRAGFKWRRQPLLFEITNSGFDRYSVCYQHHDYSTKILEGALQNDRWFTYICALDEGDDWRDESVWFKANPNLDIIGQDYLRDRVREAEAMPAVENVVKRLNFCIWTEQSERAVQMDLWDKGAASIDLASLRNRVCYGGLDLARVSDLSAFVLLFPPIEAEESWKVLPFFWVPDADIVMRSRNGVPYDVWVRNGYMYATDGNTTDYSFIEAKIIELAGFYNIRAIAFDRTFAGEIVQHLQSELGHDRLIDCGQGFLSMAAPTAEFLRLVKAEKLQHGGHPVLRWNASNLQLLSDPAGNLKPDKSDEDNKIDGISAMAMAFYLAIRNANETGRSKYESEGLIVL